MPLEAEGREGQLHHDSDNRVTKETIEFRCTFYRALGCYTKGFSQAGRNCLLVEEGVLYRRFLPHAPSGPSYASYEKKHDTEGQPSTSNSVMKFHLLVSLG